MVVVEVVVVTVVVVVVVVALAKICENKYYYYYYYYYCYYCYYDDIIISLFSQCASGKNSSNPAIQLVLGVGRLVKIPLWLLVHRFIFE